MSARSSPADPPMGVLPNPVPGRRRDVQGRAGRVAVFDAGTGPPMLLLHSVNAAASAYEVRPIFERMASTHRVFAPDLPGYGASDRSDRRYEPALFGAAIDDVLDAIGGETDAAPVDVLALSTCAEFAARAALRLPGRFRTLAMVTPTGLDRRSESLRGEPDSNREVSGVHRFLSRPLWSQRLFDLLVSRRSVRYFLQRTYGSKAVDAGLCEYCWQSAHQPGARHAPLAFLSGRLFSRDIRTVYERLVLPVWMPHGTRGDFKDFSGADWTRSRANWTVQPFETGALPHFEQPDAFIGAYRRFLQG